ncbi:hypothetical protein QBC40DRAFT_284490 [Triangularia verruculosa]|uniref:Uncharacterized protein n=1 Tax=Triangularia verruculosa TaxID=2587418 RepID=A0AAN7AR20_9PEZI|nr:hypothetical protein QBC40DRAFT_284490 [Triangularia verruculosa]
MSVQTPLTYAVSLRVLERWLSRTFGAKTTVDGTARWSYKPDVQGRSSFWVVTAPRSITKEEQQDLELRSAPRTIPISLTF